MRFKIFFFLAFFATSAVTAQLYDNRNRYLQSPYNYNRFGQELDAPPKKPTNQYAPRVTSSQNSYNNYQNRVNQYSRAYLTTDEFYKRYRDPEIHNLYANEKKNLGGSESGINLKDCHCNYGLDIKAFDSWYQAQQMARETLLKQYEGLFEKKIEKLLNKNFPSFKEAQKAFYKDYAKIYQNHYRAEEIKFSESNLQREIIIAFESASANETIWKTFYNGYNGEGKISKDGERIWFGDLRSNNELIRDLIRSTHGSRAKSTKLRTLNSKVRGLLKDFEISKEIKTQLQRSSSLFYDYLADEYIAHYESLKYDYEHLLGAFNNYLIQYAENIPSIAMYGRKYSEYMIHKIPYNENDIWNALRKKVEGTINKNQNYSSNVSFARAKAIFALDRLNLPTLYWANRSFAQKRRDTSARKKRPLPLPCEPQDVSAKKTHVNNVVRAIKNKEPLRKAVLTYLEHATPYQQEINTITEAVGCRLNGSPFNWSELVNFPKYTFQSSANPEVVLQIDLSENKVHKNISYRGIADVLKYIYNVEKYWHVEGATIRHFLESKTNVKIPGSLSNYDLGKLFDFGGGNSNTLTIQFSDYAKKYITNFRHGDGKYGTSLFTDPFKLQALKEILDGNTVDFQDEIIIDSSFIGTKADCILKLLLWQNGYFKDVMDSFTNNNSIYKIKYEVKPLTKQNSAGDGETPPPDKNGIITIRISPSALSNNSLDLASTILHESVHAMLHRILATNNQSKYNLSTADYNWLLNLNAFWNDNSAFPEITTQHDFMTVRYVIPIAEAVRGLDKNRYPLKNYMFFGWSGLYDEGKNRGLINRSTFIEFSNLADVPLNDNHKTPCD